MIFEGCFKFESFFVVKVGQRGPVLAASGEALDENRAHLEKLHHEMAFWDEVLPFLCDDETLAGVGVVLWVCWRYAQVAGNQLFLVGVTGWELVGEIEKVVSEIDLVELKSHRRVVDR